MKDGKPEVGDLVKSSNTGSLSFKLGIVLHADAGKTTFPYRVFFIEIRQAYRKPGDCDWYSEEELEVVG